MAGAPSSAPSLTSPSCEMNSPSSSTTTTRKRRKRWKHEGSTRCQRNSVGTLQQRSVPCFAWNSSGIMIHAGFVCLANTQDLSSAFLCPALLQPQHGGFSAQTAQDAAAASARFSPAVPLVAVCLEHTFGPDCSLTCDDCQNGATCNAEGSGCHCPAGWTGLLCNQSEWQLCA